jgi:hypothetical protein
MKILAIFFVIAATVLVPTGDVFARKVEVTCKSGKTSSYDDKNMSSIQKRRIENKICAVSGVAKAVYVIENETPHSINQKSKNSFPKRSNSINN